jgi:hypothetical protein
MVESNKLENVFFEKNFKTNVKENNGIPMISPWSIFSIFKNGKTIKEYAMTPDIFKVWLDDEKNVHINIRVEKINKKWPEGEIEYFLQVFDMEFNEMVEERGIFYNESGRKKEKKKRVARPWDFLMPNTEYVSSLEAKERLDICKQCPKLTAKVCQECGCFMPLKTKLKHAECPIGKW